MSNKPDFIIMGGMKCATSTLHEQLACQPGIFMTEPKEPNFFSNDEEYEKGMDWYLSLFADAAPGDLCGESSTHYTKLPTYPQTVERLHAAFPDVKLIYVMRHPIDRLVSQYIHEWSQRAVNGDINDALTRLPELIAYSQYSIQLQPYFETYGKSKILPVFFERMIQNPQAELERICAFLGYPHPPKWQECMDAHNVSSKRMRKSAWRDFLVNQPVLANLRRQFVPKAIRTWVWDLWTMKQRPELSPDNIAYLKTVFNDDLATLGLELGTPLDCDTFKQVVKAQPLDWAIAIRATAQAN